MNTGYFFFLFPQYVYYSRMCCNIQKCNEWLRMRRGKNTVIAFSWGFISGLHSVPVKKPLFDYIKPVLSWLLCSLCLHLQHSSTWCISLHSFAQYFFFLYQWWQNSNIKNKTHRSTCLQIVLELFFLCVLERKRAMAKFTVTGIVTSLIVLDWVYILKNYPCKDSRANITIPLPQQSSERVY